MQVIAALLAAILGGVIAAALTYVLNYTKEQAFFMRKKAEDLYLAFQQFDKSLSGYFLSAYPLIKGQIGLDEFHDLIIERAGKEDGMEHNNVLMLTDIYFPSLRPKLDAYFGCRTELNSILGDHKRAYATGEADPQKFFSPFHNAVGKLDPAADAFLKGLLHEARKLATLDALWPSSLTWSSWRARSPSV